MTGRCGGNGRIWRRKQKGGWVYVADWRGADGKRHRKALSPDKRVAERMLADIIRNRDLCAAGLGIEEGLERPIREISSEFLADLRMRCSKAYADRVAAILSRIIRELRLTTIRDLQPQPFLQYRHRRLGEGISNTTANMELTVAGTMLRWAIAHGFIAFNPLQGVRKLPAGKAYEKRPRRALSEDEIARFLEASIEIDRASAEHAAALRTIQGGSKGKCYAGTERALRVPQTPLWLTLLETGGRFGETVQTTWGDFSEAGRSLTFRAGTTKNKRARRLPIRMSLVEAINGLRLGQLHVRGRLPIASDHIFLTPKGAPWVENRHNALKRLLDVLERAGIPRVDERGEKIDIHALRHTFASRLARNGVGLAQAQKLLGHSDPKLTAAIYTHLDTEDLRAAVECLPPVSLAQA